MNLARRISGANQSPAVPQGNQMPSVFLSYSRADSNLIEQLEQSLVGHGVSVWRDQEKIYGGAKWPRALGEAIADNDIFLLAWSKDAAVSEYVELEWCTAIALKKSILPCLLDETPLPAALRSIQAVHTKDLTKAVERIVESIESRGRELDVERRADVVNKLEEIASNEPAEVLRAARALFDQREWNVHGNVFQAAGDIHVTTAPPTTTEAEKSLLDRWQTWVALLVGILTAITLALSLPEKLGFTSRKPARLERGAEVDSERDQSGANRLVEQPVSGSVRDEAGNPVRDVQVSLPTFGLITATDSLGEFRIVVRAPKQATVGLMARKDGFATYEADVTLGNTGVGVTMRRQR